MYVELFKSYSYLRSVTIAGLGESGAPDLGIPTVSFPKGHVS